MCAAQLSYAARFRRHFEATLEGLASSADMAPVKRFSFVLALAAVLASAATASAFTGVAKGVYKTYSGAAPMAQAGEPGEGIVFALDKTGAKIAKVGFWANASCTDDQGNLHEANRENEFLPATTIGSQG